MEKLSIPKKIHVGYQERSGTYTGKLAYVIYTDQRGKKRKEPSWNSWRDNKIEPEDFDNEPTTGFVLNKGVGGQRESWGWNARNEYIRVYDPRGFEFEISVANLLFILTNCTATKGKGLEGEFVYSWDGKDLILLPVDCFEYRASTEFTKLQTKKVTKAEMHEGWTYRHKDTKTVVYMGRHKTRKLDSWYDSIRQLLAPVDKPWHVFYVIENDDWRFERGFTNLAEVASQESYPDFADLYTRFTSSRHAYTSPAITLQSITAEDAVAQKGRGFLMKVDAGYQLVAITDFARGYNTYHHNHHHRYQDVSDQMSADDFWPTAPIILPEITNEAVQAISRENYHWSHYYYDAQCSISPNRLEGEELFTLVINFGPNETEEAHNYVERRADQTVS